MWNYESKITAEWIWCSAQFLGEPVASWLLSWTRQQRMRDFSDWSFWRVDRSRLKGMGLDVKEAWGEACFMKKRGPPFSKSTRVRIYHISFTISSWAFPNFLTSPNGEQWRTWPFEVLRFRAAGTFVYPGFLSCRNRSTTMESILATEIGRKLQHLASLRISRSSFMAFRPQPAFWSTLAGLA